MRTVAALVLLAADVWLLAHIRFSQGPKTLGSHRKETEPSVPSP